MTSKRTSKLVAMLVVTFAIAAAPASAATGISTLTNEQLAGCPSACDYHVASASCDPAGTSTISFYASGSATIFSPYQGTFVETGTATIGPQILPPQFDPGYATGPILQVDATFTIYSGTTTITGTKHELVGDSGFGVCGTVDGQTIERIAANTTYQASIATPNGTFTDAGTTYLGFIAQSGPLGAGAAFNEQFVSTQDEALPEPPTSAEQCKKDGWQSFGIFKNQGDCVSYIATGGRNPPAGP